MAAIWGIARTRWVRHLAHWSDREALIVKMATSGFRPRLVCGSSLPIEVDPWIILPSVGDMMDALKRGDKICKKCQAHVGLYQLRAHEQKACDICIQALHRYERNVVALDDAHKALAVLLDREPDLTETDCEMCGQENAEFNVHGERWCEDCVNGEDFPDWAIAEPLRKEIPA